MTLNTARARSLTAALAAAAMCASGLVLGMSASASAADSGVIPDPGLRACVNFELGRTDEPQAPITAAELSNFTQLTCGDWFVDSFAGIQAATNLSYLQAQGSANDAGVAPVTQLRDLSTFVYSNFRNPGVTTIAPFAKLPKLERLEISDALITSTAPFAAAGAFPALRGLSLAGNRISDVESLAKLGSLAWVTLDRNRVTDLSPLGSLPQLEEVSAEDQMIPNLPAIVGVSTPNPVRDLEGAALVPSVGEDHYRPGEREFRFDVVGLYRGDWSDSVTTPVIVSFNGTIGWDVRHALTVGTPTVAGTARVGSVLTAKPGTWGPAGVALSYQWKRNGAPIPGATGARYTVRASDLGTRLSVAVTGALADHATTTTVSTATATVAKGVLRAATPKISGTAKVGKTLKLKRGSWTPGTSFRYQWLRNGKKIAKATKSSYRLSSKDAGKRITVRVTGAKPGYAAVTKISRASKRVMLR